MRTVVKVALGVLLGAVVVIGGCAALIGGGTPVSEEGELVAPDDGGERQEQPSAEAPAKQVRIDSGSASGDFAIASADGTIDDPSEVRMRVRATPPQEVQATWTMTCAQGTGAGSSDDQFNATTPVSRRLKLPSKDPNDCTVAANAQLAEGGKVTVTLTGKGKR